ncbi:hypothetical protein [Streptosporangium roseum]|uniref:hypothetical protein n=1 Tax=Streptosporangium roseum TaxID=2001 RepID=UPI003328A6B7
MVAECGDPYPDPTAREGRRPGWLGGSAAFEALAATSGVKNAGPVEGGQELLIPLAVSLEIRMVVDPETARVARANILLTAEGGSAMSNSYIEE